MHKVELIGQPVNGVTLAHRHVQGRVPEGLCQRPRGEGWPRIYFGVYNAERSHQALGYRTPAEVFTRQTGNGSQEPVDMGRSQQVCVVDYRCITARL